MDKEKLLQETIVLLSADLYKQVYDSCGIYDCAVDTIIDLAKKFEKELNWQDDDERDYIVELEKYESRVMNELKCTIMNKETTRMKDTLWRSIFDKTCDCKDILEDRLTMVVKNIGEDYDSVTDMDGYNYYKDLFGLTEDEDGWKITKILDFYNSRNGCTFTLSRPSDHTLFTQAFRCLYIVTKGEEEYLKHYCLLNDGSLYDKETAEPEHDYVSELSLTEMDYLLTFITRNFLQHD